MNLPEVHLLWLCFALSGCFLFPPEPPAPTSPGPPSETFSIRLDLRDSEESEDSSVRRFKIAIDDHQVFYYGPYGEGERGQYEHREVAFRLTDAQLRRVQSALHNRGLLTDIDDNSGDIGLEVIMHTYVEIEASFIVDGERFEVRIKGPTGGFPNEEIEPVTHLAEAKELISLCEMLWRWAE
jgi:hypothetical protein